jgi:SNF2 family DNA or RNA helicase
LTYLNEMLPELLRDGRKCLIFSQFKGFLRLLSDFLEAKELGHLMLTGDTAQ